MTIVVAPQAGKDLREAYEFEAVTGREVLLRDGRWVKTWPVPPYRIYYRVSGQELQVIRVYHQARRPIER
jgi:hypothetical protein